MKKRYIVAAKVYLWERKPEYGFGILDTKRNRFAPYFIDFPPKERAKRIKNVKNLCAELNDNPRIYYKEWLSWCRIPKGERS